MKKLIILCILFFVLFACKKSDQNQIPKPEAKPENSIRYNFTGKINEIKAIRYTIMNTRVIYNITMDELAPQGFQIWQKLGTTGYKYSTVVNKALLTKRNDSIDFKFNLWEYGVLNVGDTVWLSSEIISMKTSDIGTTIAKTELFPIIIK